MRNSVLVGICGLLVVITLVSYWGVWNSEFVYFDDPGYVSENLHVQRGLTLENIKWAFLAYEQSNWHPLTWISHMIDIQIYGLAHPGGHHMTNLILHLGNTLLIFLLLRWMTGRAWLSAAVAALFAVHPLHVESVAWVAERKDMLSTFIGLLTMWAYVAYSRQAKFTRDTTAMFAILVGGVLFLFYLNRTMTPNAGWCALLLLALLVGGGAAITHRSMTGQGHIPLYCLMFVLLATGLLAKPMLVTMPFMLLLLDFWPLKRVDDVAADMLQSSTPRGRPDRAPATPRDKRKLRRLRREAASANSAPEPPEWLAWLHWPAVEFLVQAGVLLICMGLMLLTIRFIAEIVGLSAAIANKELPPAAWQMRDVAGMMLRPTTESMLLLLLVPAVIAASIFAPRLAREKIPLLTLTAISAYITPIAQHFGGSMASAGDLPIEFRVCNTMESYVGYIGQMFLPRNLIVLKLLDLNIDMRLVVAAGLTLVIVTALVAWGLIRGRRYLAVGWLWYLGTLVPVIGLVQVGEQAMADRYTYMSYVGLFIMGAWGLADLAESWPSLRPAIIAGALIVLSLVVGICSPYSLSFAVVAESRAWMAVNIVAAILLGGLAAWALLRGCRWVAGGWLVFAVGIVALATGVAGRVVQSLGYAGVILISPVMRGLAATMKWSPNTGQFEATATTMFCLVLLLGFVAAMSGLAIWAGMRRKTYLAVGWFALALAVASGLGLTLVGGPAAASTTPPTPGTVRLPEWAQINAPGLDASNAVAGYIPLVGLLIMGAWGIDEIIGRLPQYKIVLTRTVAGTLAVVLAGCIWLTNCQTFYWTNKERLLQHALDIAPDNWSMHNNMGVYLWEGGVEDAKKAGEAMMEVQKFEVTGKPTLASEKKAQADAFMQESVDKKKRAVEHWEWGCRVRPTAADIHNNLGYARAEEGGNFAAAADRANAEAAANEATTKQKAADLKAQAEKMETTNRPKADELKAEAQKLEAASQQKIAELKAQAAKLTEQSQQKFRESAAHLEAAMKLKPILAGPHNNYGRILLRMHDEEGAIAQFKEAIKLDDSLLEGRANLAEVYLMQGDRALNEANAARNEAETAKQAGNTALNEQKLAEAKTKSALSEEKFTLSEEQWKAILAFVADPGNKEKLGNYVGAHRGLAAIREKQGRMDEAVQEWYEMLKLDGGTVLAHEKLSLYFWDQRQFDRAKPHLMAQLLLRPDRFKWANDFGMVFWGPSQNKPLKPELAMRAWAHCAFLLATMPEDFARNGPEAVDLAQRAVNISAQMSPAKTPEAEAADALAAALAEVGNFQQAVNVAQQAVNLATQQQKSQLASEIAARLQLYQRGQKYRIPRPAPPQP